MFPNSIKANLKEIKDFFVLNLTKLNYLPEFLDCLVQFHKGLNQLPAFFSKLMGTLYFLNGLCTDKGVMMEQDQNVDRFPLSETALLSDSFNELLRYLDVLKNVLQSPLYTEIDLSFFFGFVIEIYEENENQDIQRKYGIWEDLVIKLDEIVRVLTFR